MPWKPEGLAPLWREFVQCINCRVCDNNPMPANHAPSGTETSNLALFCDFENIALGVRDARFDKFDISRILERLLLKGSIVVKKAYCDWERYKEFKPAMHYAG